MFCLPEPRAPRTHRLAPSSGGETGGRRGTRGDRGAGPSRDAPRRSLGDANVTARATVALAAAVAIASTRTGARASRDGRRQQRVLKVMSRRCCGGDLEPDREPYLRLLHVPGHKGAARRPPRLPPRSAYPGETRAHVTNIPKKKIIETTYRSWNPIP